MLWKGCEEERIKQAWFCTSRTVGSCCMAVHHCITLGLCSSFWETGRLLSFITHPNHLTSLPQIFSLPQFRFALKFENFQSKTEIQSAVTRELISIMKETYLAGGKCCVNMQQSA
jgi:hypothetical protein